MVNEIASWLNCEHHVFFQHPGCAEGAEAWLCGAGRVVLQVATHIMHIQPKKVAKAMWLEHCPKVDLQNV